MGLTNVLLSLFIKFVSRYAVWYRRMLSPFGSSVLQPRSLRYGFKVECLTSVNCIRSFEVFIEGLLVVFVLIRRGFCRS